MKKLTTLFFGVGLIALQGCSGGTGVEDVGTAQSELTPSGTASLVITSDWGTGYCANVTMQNALTVATTRWQVIIDLKNTAMPSAPWNTVVTGTTGIITAHPASYNTSIPAGSTTSFGFCGTSPVGGGRPVIKAWNMEANYFTTCQTNNGLFPAKAALAVAMGTELGRWDPDTDLAISGGKVVVSATGLARCTNSCKNTKALLGQQSYTPDQNIFNNVSFSSDLQSSFGRQASLISNLTMNNKSQLPPDHKLKLVGGPMNLGFGNCGPHFVFQVDYASGINAGKPVSTTDAANMSNALCFYGQGSCGGNPYLGFVKNQVTSCPTGKMCIAIDPTDGDNSTYSTTTAGSAPTYPANRVYDPAKTLLTSQCITAKGKLATMIDKCSAMPDTCGYLYCQ